MHSDTDTYPYRHIHAHKYTLHRSTQTNFVPFYLPVSLCVFLFSSLSPPLSPLSCTHTNTHTPAHQTQVCSFSHTDRYITYTAIRHTVTTHMIYIQKHHHMHTLADTQMRIDAHITFHTYTHRHAGMCRSTHKCRQPIQAHKKDMLRHTQKTCTYTHIQTHTHPCIYSHNYSFCCSNDSFLFVSKPLSTLLTGSSVFSGLGSHL